MASLATAAELAVYLQTATADEAAAGDPNVLDTVIAEQALASASAKIRGAAGWSITTGTYSKVISEWGGEVFLPVQQVTDLTVTAGGVPVTAGAYLVDTDSGVLHLSRLWGYYGVAIQVVYTAGYDTVPDGPKGLCLELAAQIYSNPTGEIQTTYGQVVEQHLPRSEATRPEDLRMDARLSPYVVTAFA